MSGDEFGMFPEEPLVSAETDEDDPGEEIAGCKNMTVILQIQDQLFEREITVKDELIILVTC